MKTLTKSQRKVLTAWLSTKELPVRQVLKSHVLNVLSGSITKEKLQQY